MLHCCMVVDISIDNEFMTVIVREEAVTESVRFAMAIMMMPI